MNSIKLAVIIMIANLLNSYAQEIQIVDIYDVNLKNYLLQSFLNSNQDHEIDVDEARAFVNLDLSNQNIKSLYGIEEFTNLEHLDFSGNHVRILDLSRNQKLRTLRCDNNDLVYLEIIHNQQLKHLSCHGNQLPLLKLPHNLKYLKASNNNLMYIDLSKVPKLTMIHISHNKLKSLKITNNIYLTEVSCSNNLIDELNIKNNTNLTSLDCSSNRIVSLDSRNNHKLKFLNCENNDLQSLKIYYTGFGSSSLQSLNATENRSLIKIHTNDLYQARIALSRRDLLIDSHTRFVRYDDTLNIQSIYDESKILFSISKYEMKYETESEINTLSIELLDSSGQVVLTKTELIKGQIKKMDGSLTAGHYIVKFCHGDKTVRKLATVVDYLNHQLIRMH